MKCAFVAAIALLAVASTTGAQDKETRRHLLHELSGPFIVYRSRVQKELRLSEDQKRRLEAKVPEYLQATASVFENLKGTDAAEQAAAMQSHREKLGERYWAFLKGVLKAGQLQRFQQLELQHEGPAALFRPGVASTLKLAQEQRQQIMRVIQELQAKLEALVREAGSGGNPQQVLPRAIKVRGDYDRRIEALMSGAQRAQWRSMRGQPFDVWHDD